MSRPGGRAVAQVIGMNWLRPVGNPPIRSASCARARAVDAATTDDLAELARLAHDDDARVRAVCARDARSDSTRARRAHRNGDAPPPTPTRAFGDAPPSSHRAGPFGPERAVARAARRRRRVGRRSGRVRHRRTSASDARRQSTRSCTRATTHDDPLVREAAVAALGAHRRSVRRCPRCSPRATTSPRSGGGRCSRSRRSTATKSRRVCAPRSNDPDWQVRQAAEDLLGPDAATP